MDKRSAFKVAFLRACANKGMSMEETHATVKRALAFAKSSGLMDMISKPFNAAVDVAGSTAKGIGNMGLTAAVLAPPLLGLGAGYGLSRLTDIDDEDIDEVKIRDLINEHRRLTDMLRRRAAMKQ
jgi:hypothetical protein